MLFINDSCSDEGRENRASNSTERADYRSNNVAATETDKHENATSCDSADTPNAEGDTYQPIARHYDLENTFGKAGYHPNGGSDQRKDQYQTQYDIRSCPEYIAAPEADQSKRQGDYHRDGIYGSP